MQLSETDDDCKWWVVSSMQVVEYFTPLSQNSLEWTEVKYERSIFRLEQNTADIRTQYLQDTNP
jgi:hypothetical protein